MADHPQRIPIAAWGERCSGPGWSNSPVWVLVRDTGDGSYHLDCLQPEEQTAEIVTLFRISAEVSAAMLSAVMRRGNG